MKFPLFGFWNHLINCRQYGTVMSTALCCYGVIWIGIEMFSYFSSAFEERSRGNLWIFLTIIGVGLLIGFVHFLVKCVKMLSVSQKLGESDIMIEIRVGDVFDMDGGFIISTNTTFDTDMSDGLISEYSLQGQFTQRYYDDVNHLDHELERELETQEYTSIGDCRRGKKVRYEIGTVVRLQPRNQVAYLLAIADMNEHGVAEGSFEELRKSLGKLWHYIGERGELGPLVAPVLGTGRARMNAPREEVIREIIKSFIAACSERKFCEKLIVVIFEKDYHDQSIDIQELGNYLRHYCKYSDLKKKTDTGTGEAIP